MSNHNFQWTSNLILRMIDLFREKPELWDSSSAHYNDKLKKQIAWNEIANAMNIDVHIVERKIKMLMGQYRRELTRKPGSESKWFAYNRMSFLTSQQQPNMRRQYITVNDTEEPAPYFISMSTCHLDEQKSENSVQEEIVYNYDEPRRKERKKSQPDNSRQELENSITADTPGKDEYATYGELVAMKLRKLDCSYARSTAQYHINNILYKAEIGKFDKRKRSRQENSFQRHDDDNSSTASKSGDDLLKIETDFDI